MQETSESLGRFLKNKREENNISIEQVAYATRIGLKMLRALEEDDHTALPAPTFVRGYLQAYSKYARLDTQDVLLRYQHHLAMEPDSRKGAIKSHYLYVRERYQEKRRMVLVLVLFVLMLGVAGTYGLLKHKRDKNKSLAHEAEQIKKGADQAPAPPALPIALTPPLPEPGEKPLEKSAAAPEKAPEKMAEKMPERTAEKPAPKAEPAKPVVPPPVVKAEPAPAPPVPAPKQAAPVAPAIAAVAAAPVAPAATPAADEKRTYNLLLRAEEDTWLRYQTDEDPVKDLTLRSGKAIMLRANKVMKVFSGNLGALKGTMNGQAMDALVTDKKVKSLILPASEVANYKLPLFPQFKTKKAPAADAPQQEPPKAQ